jgi:toxin YoeB
MTVSFEEGAWEEYLYWQKTDRKILQKINELIKSIQREPFTGVGKPEKLRFDLSGYWSRRINKEHRLVYRVDVESGRIVIIQCRLNYG